MRLNVYSQELTQEVKLVSAVAKDTGITYYGIRLYLASPDVLHSTPDDDDRSAVTFWIPHCKSFTASDLSNVFDQMSKLAMQAAWDEQARYLDNGSTSEV